MLLSVRRMTFILARIGSFANWTKPLDKCLYYDRVDECGAAKVLQIFMVLYGRHAVFAKFSVMSPQWGPSQGSPLTHRGVSSHFKPGEWSEHGRGFPLPCSLHENNMERAAGSFTMIRINPFQSSRLLLNEHLHRLLWFFHFRQLF